MTGLIPSLIDEFSRRNEPLRTWSESVFTRLCEDDRLTWLFMNTLSYMEHIGSYKIMATQGSGQMDYQTLKHLNEETGHAVLFKRHAERLNKNSLDYSEVLAPASARAYFGRLEALMVKYYGDQANARTVYLYMSLIVEFRAVWGYEILEKCMQKSALDISLARLLAEEQGHLYSMVRRLQADQLFSEEAVRYFSERERELYIRLLTAIEETIGEGAQKVA